MSGLTEVVLKQSIFNEMVTSYAASPIIWFKCACSIKFLQLIARIQSSAPILLEFTNPTTQNVKMSMANLKLLAMMQTLDTSFFLIVLSYIFCNTQKLFDLLSYFEKMSMIFRDWNWAEQSNRLEIMFWTPSFGRSPTLIVFNHS